MTKKIVTTKRTAKKVVKKDTVTKRDSTASIYQVKITLRAVKPVVWRRILIESDKTMFDLYCAILESMGWSGGHLFAFRVGSARNGVEIGVPSDETFTVGDEIRAAWKEPLAEWLAPGKKLVLEYDFGDGWEHDVVLEKMLEREPKAKYPQCIDGKQACPPDDIGGPWGYMELLEAAKDPHNPKYADLIEMFIGNELEESEDFAEYLTPDHFDPKEVHFSSNKDMLKMFQRGY